MHTCLYHKCIGLPSDTYTSHCTCSFLTQMLDSFCNYLSPRSSLPSCRLLTSTLKPSYTLPTSLDKDTFNCMLTCGWRYKSTHTHTPIVWCKSRHKWLRCTMMCCTVWWMLILATEVIYFIDTFSSAVLTDNALSKKKLTAPEGRKRTKTHI